MERHYTWLIISEFIIINSWVFSSLLSATDTTGHEIYDPSRSTTAVRKEGYTWNIIYGDGSGASGDVYTDTVNVGGTSVAGQAVEVASRVSAQFQRDVDSDGLLGLSFSSSNTGEWRTNLLYSLSSSSSSIFLFVYGGEQDVNGSQLTLVRPKKQLTFFDNAKSSLSNPLFTVDLKKNAPGSYNFGFIDDSKYTGTITYVPVDSSRGFWEFTSEGYSVGSSRSFKSVSIDAIADTGTTLLYLPDAVVQDYYGAVSSASYSSSQGGYIFPCDASLPSISLGIGTYRAVIPGPFMNYAPIDETGSGMFFFFFPPKSISFINIISSILSVQKKDC